MSYKINYTTEEKIKLAKDDSIEKLYESKKNQRTVRVLTVCAYVLTVSMAAIILSLYYVFLWVPTDESAKDTQNLNIKCEKIIIIPETIAIRLANNSDISVDKFIKNLQKMQQDILNSQTNNQQRMNRTDFNNYLNFKSKSIEYQRDAPNEKKLRRKMNKKKKFQDDEDLDMESSGEKSVTTVFPTQAYDFSSDLNDTTIIFDQEQDD
ncbi:CLUMA_CG019988, isoform A [Clunio marinus]|uniref:CLUMA_CG019988, isoform A n=1 Tax=Clunio marinus TaxID=568069 RepID=A0A1J1J3K8_9DIPT|nr:CLUMA_CG019988, isoform A [Clunio marinus]